MINLKQVMRRHNRRTRDERLTDEATKGWLIFLFMLLILAVGAGISRCTSEEHSDSFYGPYPVQK